MSSVDAIAQYSASANSAGAASSVEDMGSDQFLQLMVAQLQNQNPTEPMDNMQFMSELAQFGTVSGIQELNDSFAALAGSLGASQNMQAVNMVGREVVVDSNIGLLREQTAEDGEQSLALDASVELPAGTSAATLYITDSAGRLVHSSVLPVSGSGDLPVRWDGLDAEGEALEPGRYRVSAEGLVGGQSQALNVYAHLQVDSVSLQAGAAEAELNLADGQSVTMGRVRAFL